MNFDQPDQGAPQTARGRSARTSSEVWRDRLGFIAQLLRQRVLTAPSLEAVYRDLFIRDLAAIGVNDAFYPVGSAANHSLLYLVLRCVRELGIRKVSTSARGRRRFCSIEQRWRSMHRWTS
jgi:hypothetical protein